MSLASALRRNLLQPCASLVGKPRKFVVSASLFSAKTKPSLSFGSLSSLSVRKFSTDPAGAPPADDGYGGGGGGGGFGARRPYRPRFGEGGDQGFARRPRANVPKPEVVGPVEKGTVKWFDQTKGFGFITRESNEDIFVHFSNIVGEGFRLLEEGAKVEFKPGNGHKGLTACDVKVIH